MPHGRVWHHRAAARHGDAPLTQADLDRFFGKEYGRCLSVLLRTADDLGLCEDALQDALEAALGAFSGETAPANLSAWVITVARRKLIDRLRKTSREVNAADRVEVGEVPVPGGGAEDPPIPDERLTLIFLCCHPALPEEQRIALTLSAVCGLKTAQIAKLFLTTEPTMAQRLVRAKRRIQESGIRFELPDAFLVTERLESVWKTIYLVFTEGYRPSGETLVRHDLCDEALFLARLVERLLRSSSRPWDGLQTEALGLLSLILLATARTKARIDPVGQPVLLQDQDRSGWDQERIREGKHLLEKALSLGSPGSYQIQAAIHLVHLESPPGHTDWRQIAGLYNALLAWEDTATIRLNYAVAMSFVAGPEYALALVQGLEPGLAAVPQFYLTRAHLQEKLGRRSDALSDYHKGLLLEPNAALQTAIRREIARLEAQGRPPT